MLRQEKKTSIHSVFTDLIIILPFSRICANLYVQKQILHLINNTMKKIALFQLLALVLTFTACNRNDDDPLPSVQNPPDGSTDPINLGNCGGTASTDLIAGQHTVIGKVTVSTDGNLLTVKYELNQPNWGITQTHLSVKGDWHDIPQTPTGNPIPGQFESKLNHNKIIGYTYYDIDVSAWDNVSIAAHCKVVQMSGVNPNPIPDLVPGLLFQMDPSLTGSQSNISSFVDLNLSGNSVGSGLYEGFCVDHNTPLTGSQTYTVFTVDPFVADEDDLNCMGLERPENVDLVAYLINQYYTVGYANAQGEELQAAIWQLVEPAGATITSTLITWDQSVVDAMIADAQNGEDYIPGLCDYRFLLLDMHCSDEVAGGQPEHQTTITIIPPQECITIGEETAWGFGPQFPGANWGMYFNYCVR
jgi:hypothetical protein